MSRIYTPHLVFVNNKLIFQNQTVSAEWPDHLTDVDTIPGEAQGASPGARKCRITITNAVPQAGSDVDFAKAWKEVEVLDIKMKQIGSSKATAGEFLVREYSQGSGIGEATTENVTLQSVGPVPIPA